MKFKCDLQEYLKILAKIAPPTTSGNVVFQLIKGRLYLHSHGDVNSCRVSVPVEVEGEDSEFGVNLESLKSALSSRKEPTIEYVNTMLTIRSGSYKASLSTSDAMIVAEESSGKSSSSKTKTDGSWIEIDGVLAHRLLNLIKQTSIRLNSMFNAFVPVGISLSKGRTLVTCFDNHRISYIDSKESLSTSLNCTVPVESLLSVLDSLAATGFSLNLSESALLVKNTIVNARIQLPVMEGPGLQDVISLIEGDRTTRQTALLPTQELTGFLDNSRAVSVKERSELSVRVSDDKVQVSVSTNGGEVKAAFKLTKPSKKFSFKVDFEYMDEIVRKHKGSESIRISLVNDAYILCEPSMSSKEEISTKKTSKSKTKPEFPTTIISLNQE